ncbi:MAG: hypothetical protein ACI3ZT_05345 [Candidatus Cryptobacteroides sp.]
MQYIIANRGKVLMFGIHSTGHRQKDGQILINEKELVVVPGQTQVEKLLAIDGTLYSASEIEKVLQEGDWK